MGNRSIYAKNSTLSTWKEIFELLNLSESDVSCLFDEFKKLPLTNLKQLILPISDLQEALYKSETHFPQVVLSVFDRDLTKNINFGEYVCIIWSLCTLPESKYSNFILEVYDEHGSGELSSGLVRQLVHDLYGDHKKHLTGIQKHIATVPGGFFTDALFSKFCRKYPALLAPLKQIRQHLRSSILGEHFWDRLSHIRAEHKHDVNVRQLRFLLLECCQALMKNTLSANVLSPQSGKVHPDIARMISDAATDTSASIYISQ